MKPKKQVNKMKTYCFVCNRNGNNLLYIPQNLIVIEEEDGDMFDIDYSPHSLKIIERSWKKGDSILVRNAEYEFVGVVGVSDDLLGEFRDSCFDGNTPLAHAKAMEIFMLTQKSFR